MFAPPYSGKPATRAARRLVDLCKLNNLEKRLYCGDADNGSIDVYGYPANTYQYSYTAALSQSALVTGVAPAPAARVRTIVLRLGSFDCALRARASG